MELILKCKGIKTGQTKEGKDYLLIKYGDGINGFVPYQDMHLFEGVQRGDFIETEVYNFMQEGGIKFIPRAVVVPES